MGICRVRPTICTQEIRPVCGCNGRTYNNPCKAYSVGVSVLKEGPCSN
ncbi:MAG: Kazal-type serine protease inhibitor, partial [Myxococcota bacterium]